MERNPAGRFLALLTGGAELVLLLESGADELGEEE
jgi:hypothetical protein